MWGGRRPSGPVTAVAVVATAAFVLAVSLLVPSSSWRAVLQGPAWQDGDELVQTISLATEEEVKAAFPIPAPLTTTNLGLIGYVGPTRQVLAECVVRGPGVEQPSTVGKRSYLIVAKPRGLDDDGTPLVLDEDGQKAWEAAEYAYATFENDEGVFGAWSERLNGTVDDAFRIEFWPPRAGTYEVTVDLLSQDAMWPLRHRRHSTIQVLPAEEDASIDKQGNHHPVSRCSGGLPDSRAHWYNCSAAGLPRPEECLRWGFTFRPNHGRCFYENWTPRDLVAYATNATAPKRWIVVAGTSRLRGVFLSAADHLLGGQRGEFQAISKCWGRMDVQVGSLRLTFQDFRGQDILGKDWPLTNASRRFHCHDANRASYDDSEYAHNSTLFVENLFAGDDDDSEGTPTHVVFEYIEDRDPAFYRDVIFQSIPAGWRGAATGVFFRSLVTGGMETPALDRDLREGWVSTALEGRDPEHIAVDLVDTLEIIGPWLRLGEFGTSRASQHWHSCTPAPATNTTNTTTATGPKRGSDWVPITGPPVPFAVQGLVTDQLAQMVFNRALGPRPPRGLTVAMTAAQANDDPAAPRAPLRPGLRVCTDCPPQLRPFHVKPRAELTCHDTLPVAEFKSHYKPVPPECPAWCLATPASSVMQTMSGPVEVRDCKAAEEGGGEDGAEVVDKEEHEGKEEEQDDGLLM